MAKKILKFDNGSKIAIDTELDVRGAVNVAENREFLIRYAWGNESMKTWFITKSRKAFVPKGSRLLMRLVCVRTNKPLKSLYTYPKVGDVVSDVDSEILEIIKAKLL